MAKNPHAVILGRSGGLAGKDKPARRAAAVKAAKTRWRTITKDGQFRIFLGQSGTWQYEPTDPAQIGAFQYSLNYKSRLAALREAEGESRDLSRPCRECGSLDHCRCDCALVTMRPCPKVVGTL